MVANPITAVKTNQSVYRITDRNLTFGDLVPVPLGTTAIAVGPDSDYEIYQVIYPDPTDPEGVRSITITPDRPYIGSLFANQATPYPGTEQLASLFVKVGGSGSIVFPPRNLGGGVPKTTQTFIPQPDLLVYIGGGFSPGATKRSPRIYRGALALVGTVTPNIVSIPVYGRKLVTVQLGANTVGVPPTIGVTAEIRGVRAAYPIIADAVNSSFIPDAERVRLVTPKSYPLTNAENLNLFYNGDAGGTFVDRVGTVSAIPAYGRFDYLEIEFVTGALNIDPIGRDLPVTLYYEGRD